LNQHHQRRLAKAVSPIHFQSLVVFLDFPNGILAGKVYRKRQSCFLT